MHSEIPVTGVCRRCLREWMEKRGFHDDPPQVVGQPHMGTRQQPGHEVVARRGEHDPEALATAEDQDRYWWAVTVSTRRYRGEVEAD